MVFCPPMPEGSANPWKSVRRAARAAGCVWMLSGWMAGARGADLPLPEGPLPSLAGEDQRGGRVGVTSPPGRWFVLFVADREAGEALADWPERAAGQVGERATVLGVAQLKGVPRLVAGLVRKRLARHDNPVLLDWTGTVAAWSAAPAGRVTAIVVGPDGMARAVLCGPWTAEEFDRFCSAVPATSEGARNTTTR